VSVVNGTGKDMDSLQKTWSDYYSKVEREMVQLASDVGMSFQSSTFGSSSSRARR